MTVPEQMLKIMTAEITQSLCSLVALKGPAGSDRRMKQNELIFHQQQQPFIAPHEHASAILGTAAASVSIGEAMAVMRGWRSGSDAASLSVLSTPAASDEPHVAKARTGQWIEAAGRASTAAARKPPFVFACMFGCMFARMSPSVLSPGLCNKLYSVNRELLLIELKSNFLN